MGQFTTPNINETPTFEGAAPSPEATTGPEVQEGALTEVKIAGAIALDGESAAPKSRFASLVENGKAFIASYRDPAVRKAGWNAVKTEFFAIHRTGMNTLFTVADTLPAVGKLAPTLIKKLKPIYTPDAKVSTGTKAALKTGEWVSGGVVPSHLPETVLQAKEDAKKTYRAVQEFRAAQSEAMDQYKSRGATQPAEAPQPPPKGNIRLAA
jgi:hypothetical protein